MSTLSVTKLNTSNGTIDLTITTGNTSNPGIVVSSATGTTYFGNSSFNAQGLFGISNNNAGIVGQTNSGQGIYGISNTNIGIYAISNTGIGAYIQSNTGTITQFSNATATIATVNSTGVVVNGIVNSTSLTVTTNTFNLGTFSNSANGYTRLPNGLLMQWMNVASLGTSVNAAGGAAVTFPVAFNTVLTVSVVETGSSASGKAITVLANTTGANLYVVTNAGRPGSVYVTAIGT